ncbi:MAG: nucleotidyltransferase domain-containing protein [Nitrososphaerota archaeon]|nr:nucleotidyltransferase domain-containing protein [Candidatus Calditenuaceae archaeon]MDW8073915.1 nucleotidyltransferase domain-containing protein [Nitrososphaerota archaeon]
MVRWLSNRLGTLYARLYHKFGAEGFTSGDVAELLRGGGAARVALLRLREAGVVYVHEKTPRGWIYRLADPDVYLLSVAGVLRNLEKIPQQRYSRLVGAFSIEAMRNDIGLRSIVVFGSVARGSAGVDSDVDLLIVLDGFKSLGKTVDRLVSIEYSPRVARELEWLEEKGISTHLSFHPISSQTLRKHPPIMLDVVEEGIAVVDDGTYGREVRRMKARMKELGASRVWLTDEEWVWVLKPDAKVGEVIEL